MTKIDHIQSSTQSLIKTGLQIFQKICSFEGQKRVKLSPPTEVLKTCSSAAENVLNI